MLTMGLGAALAVAAGLRLLRLDWQPLWWDEGYSIYFATESLGRMVWLTAHDIHPPLYYALLHAWIALWGNAAPVTARLLSVLFGLAAFPLLAWLAHLMFPQRKRTLLVGLLLLAISPLHIFYSQEVRMYGLALALGLASSAQFWIFVQRVEARGWRRGLFSWAALGYVASAVLGLYTLYYLALLLLAHLLWALLHWRRALHNTLAPLGADLVIGILYLPWLAYAVPQLVGYVSGKVQSDQDAPLDILRYGARHLAAFGGGHEGWPGIGAFWPSLGLTAAALVLLALGLWLRKRRQSESSAPGHTATHTASETPHAGGSGARTAAGALGMWLIVPALAGWLINLRLPFFPSGGERLLLLALPYFLLLLAYAVDRTWRVHYLGMAALGLLSANALLGTTAFLTQPRYAEHDYRPLLRQVMQQGRDVDTLLAIFPWQVGYWRAYVPQDEPDLAGPAPLLLSDEAVTWNPQVRAALDDALRRGTVWFPAPLSFGSTLPGAIEDYLKSVAANLENRWYGATRLTAWAAPAAPALASGAAPVADFRLVELLGATIGEQQAQSANVPLPVTLVWRAQTPTELIVSLRLIDATGYVWTTREAEPEWAARAAPGAVFTDTLGLIVPPGLPPGDYRAAVSAAYRPPDADEEIVLAAVGSDVVNVPISEVGIVEAAAGGSWRRLPVRFPLATPVVDGGLELLGFTGPAPDETLLAGTELRLTLFLANRAADPPPRNVYVSLLDANGGGVAGYEGWPLPEYPTQAWAPGAPAQVPVGFYLPGALTSGAYRLVAGFVDPATGVKTAPAPLGALAVEQRQASFVRPQPAHLLPEPVQFGTHVRLLGYDRNLTPAGDTQLRLFWEVLQPLLPPHHIFVHAHGTQDSPDAPPLAQQDGPPTTLGGVAPTGSWQPGEFLITEHALQLPADTPVTLRVGVYEPATGVRLPLSSAGGGAGDSLALPE